MTGSFDPLATSQLITAGYRRYLRSLLPVRDARIAAALDEEISGSLLTKGPLLESSPPYEHGAALADLIADGVLEPGFASLGGPALPLGRPLYRHQELAIRKITAGRNIVVASGTGSGKTESFLLPILNALTAEHGAGTLSPGVRALLLYPMNALANDQIKRLRQILALAPHITFGRYVGDTPDTARAAADKFALLNPGEPRLPNELLSRAEMRAAPPHLLLTNYAMLEYLLLRPADIDLFEGAHGGRWSFIAVDEAHVYDGAKAAELAMLLRRLRDRVAGGRPLRCIATSATVGDEPAAVTEFARRLFDAEFAWVPGDASRQDLVRATRRAAPEGPFWGPLDPAAYEAIAGSADPAAETLRRAQELGAGYADAVSALAHEQRVANLRALLADRPRQFDELAAELFGQGADGARSLAALVTAGSRLRDGTGSAVLPARYHLFARASEGAYTCLSAAGPHVSLARRETCGSCGAAMFEFACCKRCGALYLPGSFRQADGVLAFGPRQRPAERQVWLLAEDSPDVIDEDDETLEEPGRALDWEDNGRLCTCCGALCPADATACVRAGCAETLLWPVRRLRAAQDTVPGCQCCGARGAAMIRKFETGGDAAASVLATALYQALPPADSKEQADQPGQGRKLLLFSDSRQAAAFFAPYLETSYQAIQHRRLILDAVGAAAADEPAHVDDVAYYLVRAAADALIFERRLGRQERQRQTALWLMTELVAADDRQSLEGRGLIRVELGREPSWQVPPGLRALGLADAECWDLLAELVRSLRQQGAVTMPDGVDPRDEHFDPRRGPVYVRATAAEPKRKVLSWLPTRGLNRRLDYVQRVLAAVGSDASPLDVLSGCWRFLEQLRDGWLAIGHDPRSGVVRQLDHTWLRLAPARPDEAMYRCRQCRRLAPVSVRGACTTMRCAGTLAAYAVPRAADDDDHYRWLYRSLNPAPLRASEHTGQLASIEAADIQQRFVRGEINALSCSTTFELGVDVGELQAVVLRNMPPTTANYVQRAGRAGRRTESAALIVTYAQRRSHDLSRYQDPSVMVSGEVRAPYVPLANERIDRRHAHSVALAAFFRHSKQLTGQEWHQAGPFFLAPAREVPPSQRVRGFLTPVPEDVRRSLAAVLPAPVQAELGLATGDWVTVLTDLLDQIQAELAADVDAFEERRLQAVADRTGSLVDRYERTINTLTRRNLIGFLANRNVLPKYGFPTDTVELRTQYADPQAGGSKLDLSRDLSSAIFEFAPGAEVVAAGRLWTSGGVYRLPDRELITRRYAVCAACGGFREGGEPLDPVCPSCGAAQSGTPRQYCVPEFGFVAHREVRRPGMVPPLRSWNGATYVLSLAAEVEETAWPLANGGTATTRAGARGQLIVVSEGPNRSGYLICDWCGRGMPVRNRVPGTHSHLLRDRECTGPLQFRSLAHRYETDIVAISFDALAAPLATRDSWRSTLYALLEGVSERLQISRDDIDGTLYPTPGGRTSLVIFDAVPGGAGSAVRIARSLDDVLEAALHRVTRCDCGPETSCYGCLRGYRNQPFHDELRRGAAVDFLAPLVPQAARAGQELR